MTFYSQLGQDQWVLSQLGQKKNGFFVELGACDGLYYSNSLYFERNLEWDGICIEPNDNYFQQLKMNRKCFISNELVSSENDVKVEFILDKAVSSINDETKGPFTTNNGTNIVMKTTYKLDTILDKFNAPRIIDYLSLDVEGNEYEILRTFNFDKYKFRCMTVEHNSPHIGDTLQKKIRELLTTNGYRYIKGNDDVHNWNHGPIDDFYIYEGPELTN